MPEPANAACFDEPHWRVIARGFDTERWFGDGEAVGTGGIRNPLPMHLPTGHYYYRFASSASSPDARLGGGWWVEFETFRTIKAFADENGYRLRDAARLLLALPYAWTRVDLLARALLVRPLKAYAGVGKPAQGPADGADRGTRWIVPPHLQLRQLYIPGLFRRHDDPPLYRSAFQAPVGWTPLR